MKKKTSLSIFAAVMALVLLVSTKIQHEHLKMDMDINYQPFDSSQRRWRSTLDGLPRGIVEPTSDLELRPLWTSSESNEKESRGNFTAILGMAAGISQKKNVDTIVSKFLLGNFSVMLFHYDGNVDGWSDFSWHSKVVHVLAHNQTKWWFAKRFLHPDVVSTYDYIFLWDEDLGVDYFNPEKYLQIMSNEGLEISQPALDPELSSEIHHRITVRHRMRMLHRRVYDFRGSLNCSDESRGPPCAGWVEVMAPVFSHAAWQCVWHLIQNDLIHGWGLDKKLGYCSQGDPRQKVGVIDSEYIIHHGIPTLGGPSTNKGPSQRSLDTRTQIRRQSTAELKEFDARWTKAVREDREWRNRVDDYSRRK